MKITNDSHEASSSASSMTDDSTVPASPQEGCHIGGEGEGVSEDGQDERSDGDGSVIVRGNRGDGGREGSKEPRDLRVRMDLRAGHRCFRISVRAETASRLPFPCASPSTEKWTKLGKQQQQQRPRVIPGMRLRRDMWGNTVRVFTEEEVARHNQPGDAWLVVDGCVYDVSSWMDKHPGGIDAIMKRAGGVQDCSVDFGFHSTEARRLWQRLHIGELEGKPSALSGCVIA